MGISNKDDYIGKKLLLIALIIGLLIHGSLIYYTLPRTYDAFVHMFFADHYNRFWFEPWEHRWYTGFLINSYPPLNHQMVALFHKVLPLKIAFCVYTILIMQILIAGVYRFTKLFYSKTIAGVAAILVVLLSSIVETLHVYGQLPTLAGIGFLLNAIPFLYYYFKTNTKVYLLMALVFLSVVICSHHVTVVFGLVFFIAPTVLMALIDKMPSKDLNGSKIYFLWLVLKEGLRNYKKILLFGVLLLILIVGLIFPYWYWSKTDPITQVSIPHGSRDNFLENTSSGIVFFIIPLILVVSLLPAISFLISRKKRFLGWGISLFFCLIFGLGGTTPLAKLILGEYAFNILTLDRFGFWASIIAIPFMAKFIHSFLTGKIKQYWHKKLGKQSHFIFTGITSFGYFIFLIYIFHLGSFRSLQPKSIEINPILNFLNRDNHNHWRYLTLGFGDQMAWLSANSLAATVDGNYHSARRLPELTSRPIERLEGAKFSGDEGLSSLRHFLSASEEYGLKYVFSNDRYYDPLLFYFGWNRTIRLENGIMVWEKGNISTVVPVKPKELLPFLKKAWGIVPVSSLLVAIAMTVYYLKQRRFKQEIVGEITDTANVPPLIVFSSSAFCVLLIGGFISLQINDLLILKQQKDPETTILSYFNHLDFQRFEEAFKLFKPDVTYPLDQYLLEKSVSEGGIVPSYAKLDSIAVTQIYQDGDSAFVRAYTIWNTSLGKEEKTDSFKLVKQNNRWCIIPPKFSIEIPEQQMRSYTFTLFKKQGKRKISSFPTVKDDRVKKPFAAFKQANLICYDDKISITGEILNADDIPINIGLKAIVHFEDSLIKNYYPSSSFLFNLSPKGSSYFQIDLHNLSVDDSLKIRAIELIADTDVSERGYIHGGSLSYKVNKDSTDTNQLILSTEIYNELPIEINIPGILVAEKDSAGRIWQSKLLLHPKAARSGFHITFDNSWKKIKKERALIKNIPLTVKINGQPRKILPLKKDQLANKNSGIIMQPHCFMSEPIYLN